MAYSYRPPDSTVLPNNPTSIKQFQNFHGLVPDGIIGPKTRAKMQATRTSLSSNATPTRVAAPDYGGARRTR